MCGRHPAICSTIREGAKREAIVVGLWNTPKRGGGYIPRQAVTESKLSADAPDMQELRRQQFASDRDLRFLVEELKPFVDSNYRTLPDRANSFTMGSSAGELISAYALTEYRDVFGWAECISAHWPSGTWSWSTTRKSICRRRRDIFSTSTSVPQRPAAPMSRTSGAWMS